MINKTLINQFYDKFGVFSYNTHICNPKLITSTGICPEYFDDEELCFIFYNAKENGVIYIDFKNDLNNDLFTNLSYVKNKTSLQIINDAKNMYKIFFGF